MIALTSQQVAGGLRAACIAEVRAFKPGNVSAASPGHDMTVRDFVLSARAAAPALAAPAAGVGERILRAVQATRAVVRCNTNLGIVLLCAPLAHAALMPQPRAALAARLQATLARLDRRDAQLAYRAIRLASPGGLGTVAAHDVRHEPGVTLLEAMRAAAAWDRIAFQYAHAFADILDFGLAHLHRSVARRDARRWAVVTLYLALLARCPDSHVARQHGHEIAQEVSERAARLEAMYSAEGASARFIAELRTLDAELKGRGINPGTTADLTVAALFARRLQRELTAAAGPSTAAMQSIGARRLARRHHQLQPT